MTTILILMLILSVVVAVGLMLTASHNHREALESAKEQISLHVETHRNVLARKRLQSLHVDEYGVVDASAWNKEVAHFFKRVVLPSLDDAERNALSEQDMSSLLTELIERPVRERSIEVENASMFDSSMSPSEYEAFCASLLQDAGWDTRVTKASGDQGADVIATSGDCTVVIQCKLYSGSVGNSAVQEAFSAKRHYRCAHAVVVSSGTFTRSAKELAASTGVMLIHHDELSVTLNDLLEPA